MLYVAKGKITLQVNLREGKVSVLPASDPQESSRLLATIASNEELLAQVKLHAVASADDRLHLIQYFTARGWTVQESAPQVLPSQNPGGDSTRLTEL